MKVPKATNPLIKKTKGANTYYKPTKKQPAQDQYKDPVWQTPAPQMSVPGSRTVYRTNQNTALHHTALLNLRF